MVFNKNTNCHQRHLVDVLNTDDRNGLNIWFVNMKSSGRSGILWTSSSFNSNVVISICDLVVQHCRQGYMRTPVCLFQMISLMQYISVAFLTCRVCIHSFPSCFPPYSSSEKSLPWRTAGMSTQSKNNALRSLFPISVFPPTFTMSSCTQAIIGGLCTIFNGSIEAFTHSLTHLLTRWPSVSCMKLLYVYRESIHFCLLSRLLAAVCVRVPTVD